MALFDCAVALKLSAGISLPIGSLFRFFCYFFLVRASLLLNSDKIDFISSLPPDERTHFRSISRVGERCWHFAILDW